MKTDNELIAEFMGLIRVEANASYNKAQYYKPDSSDKRKRGIFMGYHDGLEYDTSWDWLMPVVEKIGELYKKAFPTNEIFIQKILAHEDPIEKEYIDVISTSICTPISEVYTEVIKFIKWYNEKKVPSSN